MHNKFYISILSLAIAAVFVSCGDNNTPVAAPGEVTLVSPAETAQCLKSNSGSDMASVSFSWNETEHAESYQLEIVNLSTQVSTAYKTNTCSYKPVLKVNTAYAWKVIASNSAGTTSSLSRRFYLAGASSSVFAPYPASLLQPLNATVIAAGGAGSVLVNLIWSATDPDNDILAYTVYLDDKDASTVVKDSQSTCSFASTLAAGKTYYWKIVTKDKTGNSSISSVNSFRIE